MAESPTLEQIAVLERQLEAVRAERDAAVSALEHAELQAEEQQRLLVEEQDRFVTRIIERYEQQLLRLKGEHDEAVAVAGQLRQKLERLRKEGAHAQEDLAFHLCELEARKRELEGAKRVILRLTQERHPDNERMAHLESELQVARMLLQSALESSPSPIVGEPASFAAAQSLVVAKRTDRPSRHPTAPGGVGVALRR